MTLLLIDGFDHADGEVWTAGPALYVTSPVRTGTRAAVFREALGNQSPYLDLNSAEEDDGITVGFGIHMDNGVINTATVLEFFEALTTSHIRLMCVGGSRAWEVQRGDGTVLIAADPNIWFRNTWHYIEVKVKIANSGGTVELRQDGVTRASFTGDTQNGGSDQKIDRVRLRNTLADNIYFDDVYILNEQGGSHNTFLGDTRMYPLYPNGNGNYSQLLGSDGNSTDNYLLVDEVGPAVEADYVGSATDGQKDSYTFENLPVSVGTIHAVDIRMHAWKSEDGAKSIRSLVRRSSTDAAGADLPLAVTGSPLQQLYTLDPIAAVAWTISTVNDSEFGAEVRP